MMHHRQQQQQQQQNNLSSIAIPIRRTTRSQKAVLMHSSKTAATASTEAHLRKSLSMPSITSTGTATPQHTAPASATTTSIAHNPMLTQTQDWGTASRKTKEEIYRASEMMKAALLEKKRGNQAPRYMGIVQKFSQLDQRGLLVIYASLTCIEGINDVLSTQHHRDLLTKLFQPPLDKVWSEKREAHASSPNTPVRRQMWNLSGNASYASDPISRIELPESTSEAYNNLLLHLLHCNMDNFLDPIMSLCVSHLQPVIIDATRVPNSEKLDEEWHRQHVKYDYVHTLLRSVVKLVPMYRNTLYSKLQNAYPSIQQPKLLHQHYLENLLQLANYAGDLRSDIISMVIDKVMELDAQVKVEGDDEDEDDIGEHMDLAFSSTQSSNTMSARHRNQLMADKLDTVMLLLLGYIDSLSKDSTFSIPTDASQKSSFAMNQLEGIFHTMVKIFEEKVIKTSRLHSTQFLMFYICSISPSFSKSFIEYLMAIIMDIHRHTMTRVMGIMYLASFLSRANYLTEDVIVLALGHLAQYIRQYIKTYENTVTSIDVKTHQIFYSMSQCVFYVLCYKIDQVMNAANGGGKEYLTRHLLPDLIALVHSRFNPFKVLPSDVVDEVTRTFKKYDLYDFTETVEGNHHVVISEGQVLFALENHLNMSQTGLTTEDIFPFDPYLLAQSRDFIEPIYQHWHYGRRSYDHDGVGSYSSSAASSLGGISINARRHMDDMDSSSYSMGSTPGSYLGNVDSMHPGSYNRRIDTLLKGGMTLHSSPLSDDGINSSNNNSRRRSSSLRFSGNKPRSRRYGEDEDDDSRMRNSDDEDDDSDGDIYNAEDSSSDEMREENEDENSVHMHNLSRPTRPNDAHNGFISVLDHRNFTTKRGASQKMDTVMSSFFECDDDEY